jgi:DNA invertase Pin-like site-specific DNA recombinase
MAANDTGERQAPQELRCAIYTRKSTEEGLSQEFNSLDAQRECGEAYIQSQRQQGWSVLPQHYDDGGFTGANLERPALKRLLADIELGLINCVVIYKVDRLSRSLFDFARLMDVFEKHGVSFVSVTQQLNSNTPMGRLTLNILLSFAQFERELVGERTRDKTSAARRKGKWTGGYPVLGYDPDPSRARLLVNQAEAEQVRGIFKLFLRYKSLTSTLEEVHRCGWRLKSWTTRDGTHHVGGELDRPALVRLLTNVLYRGDIPHKGHVYAGEHEAIIDRKMWKKANDLLAKRKRSSRVREQNRTGAMLSGLLVCAGCGKTMISGYTSKKGRRYPYYVCLTVQKRGTQACPGQCVPARLIEEAVIEALYQLTGDADRPGLRQALPVDRTAWEGLDSIEKRHILAKIVDRVLCDRRRRQATIQLKSELTGKGMSAEVPIRVWKEPLAQQLTPPRIEMPSIRPIQAGLPRITRLLALAWRFEELLRKGTAKDQADLAQLGGVSCARITQILNLRNLAPAIQERVLLLEGHSDLETLNEHDLRRISNELDWRKQIMMLEHIGCSNGPSTSPRHDENR